MIRWLAPMAVIARVLAGMAFPRLAAGNLTGHQLAVTINPPTLASGSSPTLTCGWHGGCLSSAGIALDWDDENGNTGNPWHFRGYFYVSDANRTAFKMFPLVTQSGGTVCDIMTVWITETHSGQLMAMPTYMHVNITNSTAFSWQGGLDDLRQPADRHDHQRYGLRLLWKPRAPVSCRLPDKSRDHHAEYVCLHDRRLRLLYQQLLPYSGQP